MTEKKFDSPHPKKIIHREMKNKIKATHPQKITLQNEKYQKMHFNTPTKH